ncbi:MAG: OmpH family outer membrane protein [Chitinophagaceae bacterium]|nr:OmpH family outer membrane protein [Chitinophagaceae bacterium]
MKKLKVLALAVCLIVAANQANAQATKIAYLNIEEVIGLIPATAKIDSLVERFVVDTIDVEYKVLLENYQFKDSAYRDSVRTPKSVRDEIAKELPSYIYQITNWNQIRDQAIQNKQQELLAPIYRQVMDAVKVVSKEKGYTHVLAREALIVMPDADNITDAVIKKLELTRPTRPATGARP